MTIEEGKHRLSILVTPLEPPFPDDVVFFGFHGENKQLAVSRTDGIAIQNMMGGNVKGHPITLVPEGDKIRVFKGA